MKTAYIAAIIATMTACADTGAQPVEMTEAVWTPDLSEPVQVELGALSEVHSQAFRDAITYVNREAGGEVFRLVTGSFDPFRVHVEVDRVNALPGNVVVDRLEDSCFITMDVAGRAHAAATGLLACLGFADAVQGDDVRADVMADLKFAKSGGSCD